MPSTAFDSMLAATMNARGHEITDQMFDAHPLPAKLKAEGRVKPWEGGEQIECIVNIGKNTTIDARDYKTPVPIAESDTLRTVAIDSRIINGSVVIYQAQKETNKGKGKVIDFMNELVSNAKTSFADAMALQAWEDGTGENQHGIAAIFSRTNTYMGIDRTGTGYAGTGIANNWWWPKMGAQYTHALNGRTYGPYETAGALTITGGTDGGLRQLYNDCCRNGGTDGPDLGFMPENLYNKIVDLIGAERIRTNEKMAQIGYPENFVYGNCTFVWDANCPSASVYMLNTKYIEIKPLSEYAKGVRITEKHSLVPQGLDAEMQMLIWRGNFVCKRPQSCGVLTAKTA